MAKEDIYTFSLATDFQGGFTISKTEHRPCLYIGMAEQLSHYMRNAVAGK